MLARGLTYPKQPCRLKKIPGISRIETKSHASVKIRDAFFPRDRESCSSYNSIMSPSGTPSSPPPGSSRPFFSPNFRINFSTVVEVHDQ